MDRVVADLGINGQLVRQLKPIIDDLGVIPTELSGRLTLATLVVGIVLVLIAHASANLEYKLILPRQKITGANRGSRANIEILEAILFELFLRIPECARRKIVLVSGLRLVFVRGLLAVLLLAIHRRRHRPTSGAGIAQRRCRSENTAVVRIARITVDTQLRLARPDSALLGRRQRGLGQNMLLRLTRLLFVGRHRIRGNLRDRPERPRSRCRHPVRFAVHRVALTLGLGRVIKPRLNHSPIGERNGFRLIRLDTGHRGTLDRHLPSKIGLQLQRIGRQHLDRTLELTAIHQIRRIRRR